MWAGCSAFQLSQKLPKSVAKLPFERPLSDLEALQQVEELIAKHFHLQLVAGRLIVLLLLRREDCSRTIQSHPRLGLAYRRQGIGRNHITS